MKALQLYEYKYRDNYAEHAGLSDDEKLDMGVIAQEVQRIIPDAVKTIGPVTISGGETIEDFHIVNKVSEYEQ